MSDSKVLHLPTGGALPPVDSGDANEFAAISIDEKLNAIVRTLRTAQLQSGEARTQGIFLAIGSLADLLRDESRTVISIAQHANATMDHVDQHSIKIDNLLARLAKVERSLRIPVREP